MPKPRVLCGACLVRPVEAKGRCHACRNYLLRTGHDRSPELFDRQTVKDRIAVAFMLGALSNGRRDAEDAFSPDSDPAVPGVRGLVYFLQRSDRMIKIGTTTDLPARKRTLESAAGQLTIVGLELGSYDREWYLHRAFASARVHGEWFAPVDALVEYLRLLRPQSEQVLSLADLGWAEWMRSPHKR